MPIPTLTEAASQSTKGGFVHIRNYLSKTSGEIAHHTINGRVSYKDTLSRALEILSKLDDKTVNDECSACIDLTMAKTALKEQRDSFEKSWQKLEDDQGTTSNYEYLAPGVATLPNDDTLYIWGLGVSKDVVAPGSYPVRKSAAKTLVKKWIRDLTPVAKFRRFQLATGTYDYVSINGEKI